GFHLQHYNDLFIQLQIDLYRGEAAEARGRAERLWPSLVRSLLLEVQIIRIVGLHLHARTLLAAAARARGSDRASLLLAAERDAARFSKEKTALSSAFFGMISAGVA